MKAIYLILLLLLPLKSFARVKLSLVLEKNQVKQGSLVKGTLSLEADLLGNLQLQKLKGNTFAKTLYFHQLDPLLRKQGSSRFETSVKVIFSDVPSSAYLVDSFMGNELEILLGEVNVQPTEAQPELIFGTFEIPPRPVLIQWGLILLGLVALYPVYVLIRRQKEKSRIRRRKLNLKQEIQSASSYEDIVGLWQRKHDYLRTFPHLEEAFRDLEQILFKYQFKPQQTADERREVEQSYRRFLTKIEGGFHGI